MCECISNIEHKALEQFKESKQFKKPIERVSIKEVVYPLSGNTLTMKTCSKLKVTLEGQRKKKTRGHACSQPLPVLRRKVWLINATAVCEPA